MPPELRLSVRGSGDGSPQLLAAEVVRRWDAVGIREGLSSDSVQFRNLGGLNPFSILLLAECGQWKGKFQWHLATVGQVHAAVDQPRVSSRQWLTANTSDANADAILGALSRPMEHLLDTLSPRSREVVLRIEVDGMGHGELAREIGIRRSSVSARYSRGRVGDLRALLTIGRTTVRIAVAAGESFESAGPY